MNNPGPHVDAVYRVAFAQHQVHVAARVERHRARTIKRRALERSAIRRWLSLARSREGVDQAGLHIDPADAVIADVGDIEPGAAGIDGDAVRLAQLGLVGRATVA